MPSKHSGADIPIPTAAGWLKQFEKHDVKYVALDLDEDSCLIKLLETRPEWTRPKWTLDLQDRQGVLFVRSDA